MSTFFTNSPEITNNAFQESTWKSTAARGAASDPKDAIKINADVFIAGSGPIGATYARILVENGYNVTMADIGELESPQRGSHKKNSIVYQKDIDKFVNVIKGALSKVSVPLNQGVINTLNPGVWRADKAFVRNGMNPEQDPYKNLPSQAVTRAIGGMGTHWTCSVPRFQDDELPQLNADKTRNYNEWRGEEGLYKIAEGYIGKPVRNDQFSESIRHLLVQRTLADAYETAGRRFEQLPLACKREPKSNPFVQWHSAHTIFDLEDRPNKKHPDQRFKLYPVTLCQILKLKEEDKTDEVDYAIARRYDDNKTLHFHAKVFILATGAISNPQILVNSKFASFGPEQDEKSKIPNLGQHITEQTMSFCQTIFYKSLVKEITEDLDIKGTPGQPDYSVKLKPSPPKNPEWWNNAVIEHMMQHQDDPLPIPFADPEPQVTTFLSQKFPWHTQIHRDAFQYGAVAETIDSRLIVDWRFFGRTQPNRANKVFYSQKHVDAYGMPQPTFDYAIRDDDDKTAKEAEQMITDMVTMSAKIGGFLPGSEPQFMEPGLALHLGGSHRSGLKQEDGDNVVDVNSKVWNFPNLFLGGVGNIPTAYGSNPTLTAMGYAIKSCKYITEKFEASKIPETL